METLSKIIAVGAGGALGSVARYLLNISPLASVFSKFPFPTLFINISGSFLIGFFLIVFADKLPISENIRLAVLIGFLGAFTTFSTFELELVDLVREKFYFTAFGYLTLSIVLGFAAVLLGIALGRRI